MIFGSIRPQEARAASVSPWQLLIGIVGGHPVPANEWQQVVALGNACTGTLVAPDIVVYAAHCGTLFREVTVGTSRSGGGVKANTIECRVHPESSLGGLDIAFCRIEKPLDISPIPVLDPCEVSMLKPGHPVTIVGFGRTDAGSTGTKHAAETLLHCATPRDEWWIGGNGIDACIADSGGPALVRIQTASGLAWRLAGVVSYGGSCGVGGYYARADVALDWLVKEAGLKPSACRSLNADTIVDRAPPSLIVDSWSRESEAEISIQLRVEDPPGGCGLKALNVEIDGRLRSPFAPEKQKVVIPISSKASDISVWVTDRAHNESERVSWTIRRGCCCSGVMNDRRVVGLFIIGLLVVLCWQRSWRC